MMALLQIIAIVHLLAFVPALVLFADVTVVYFAALFVLASLWCGYALELPRTRQLRRFFKRDRAAGLTLNAFLAAWFSVAIRIALGLFAFAFVMLGDDQAALAARLTVAVLVIVLGLLLLRGASNVAAFDEARLAYVYGPFVLGLLYALLVPPTASSSLGEIVLDLLGASGSDTLDRQADDLRGAMARLSDLVEDLLRPWIGAVAAWIVSLVVSINTLFGTVLTAFACSLMLLGGGTGPNGTRHDD